MSEGVGMPTTKQLKEADKVVIAHHEWTPDRRKLRIDMVYIDRRRGRRERTVTWNRDINDIKECLDCFCTHCSNYAVYTHQWCIYKITAAKWLVKKGYWEKYVLEFLKPSNV